MFFGYIQQWDSIDQLKKLRLQLALKQVLYNVSGSPNFRPLIGRESFTRFHTLIQPYFIQFSCFFQVLYQSQSVCDAKRKPHLQSVSLLSHLSTYSELRCTHALMHLIAIHKVDVDLSWILGYVPYQCGSVARPLLPRSALPWWLAEVMILRQLNHAPTVKVGRHLQESTNQLIDRSIKPTFKPCSLFFFSLCITLAIGMGREGDISSGFSTLLDYTRFVRFWSLQRSRCYS